MGAEKNVLTVYISVGARNLLVAGNPADFELEDSRDNVWHPG